MADKLTLQFYSDKECTPSNQIGFTSEGVTDPTIKARMADVAGMVKAGHIQCAHAAKGDEPAESGQVIPVYMRVYRSDGSKAAEARAGFSLEGVEPVGDDALVT